MKTNNLSIEIFGYGGEITMGFSSQKVYQYFQKKDISLDEFNGDESLDIPREYMPFYPGEWNECDGIAHAYGVSMDIGGIIEIKNESGKLIFESTMDIDELSDKGIVLDLMENIHVDNFYKDSVVIHSMASEKGGFLSSQFAISGEFDPKKLKIKYGVYQNNAIFNSIEYDDEEIYDEDSGTSGKSLDIEFLISKNSISAPQLHNLDKSSLTDWFSGEINPLRLGMYEIELLKGEAKTYFAEWNGAEFTCYESGVLANYPIDRISLARWRGLIHQSK